MSWQEEINELRRRAELAKAMGGIENVARQHAAGRLTVRERIHKLLDDDSFHEIGALAGKPTHDEQGRLTDILPSNFVMGTGRIAGRRVVVGGDDFTIRGGAADARIGNKSGYSEQMAYELQLPIVRLVDGSGGGGSVKTLETSGSSYVPANPSWDVIVALLSRVPVVAACLGPVAGIGAVRVATSHFSVMVKGTSHLFVAGPPLVERAFGKRPTKEELGGSHIHACENGVVDNEAESEGDALRQVRQYLSYLPQSVWQVPTRTATTDVPDRREEELLSIVPRERRQPYDMRRVIHLVVDRDSWFEIGGQWGRAIVTGFARINGWPCGVVANDPTSGGGGPDHRASEKMMRFVDVCDTFHLPVVNFVDNPGFLIGIEAERAGTVRAGARALAAIYQASVPWVSILVRRVYGVAGGGHGNAQGLNLRYAWPSGDWGSLPIEGGVQAAYKREIAAAADPQAHRRQIEERLNRFRSPFRTAETFGVEEIIDPRDTRPLLCEWIESAYEVLPAELGPKTRGCRC